MNTKRNILSFGLIAALLGSGAYWCTARQARAQTDEDEAPVQYVWEYAELYVMETPSKQQTQILFLPPNKMPRNSQIFERGRLDPNQTYFNALDIVGNLGWEMVQVRSSASQAEPFQTIYHFKRRKM